MTMESRGLLLTGREKVILELVIGKQRIKEPNQAIEELKKLGVREEKFDQLINELEETAEKEATKEITKETIENKSKCCSEINVGNLISSILNNRCCK